MTRENVLVSGIQTIAIRSTAVQDDKMFLVGAASASCSDVGGRTALVNAMQVAAATFGSGTLVEKIAIPTESGAQ